MTMISKDGEISEFPEYHSPGEEEPTEQPRALNKYGFDEDEPPEHEALDKEVDSDLESIASSKPKWKKIAKADPDRASRNYPNNSFTYKGFMACNPKEYDGKGGVIPLTRWIEKMENWNTQVQERGHKATIGMSWTDFKALLIEEFCPSNEVEKLEYEF
ncbi:hypothetical protein Tco_1547470 [Tanacetum coccineum]